MKEIANNHTTKSHEFLSEKNKLFLEFVNKNPDYLNRSNFMDVKEGHCFSDLNLNPWPTFISKETENYFRTTTVELFKLIKSVPFKIFQNDLKKMSEYYCIPIEQLDFILSSTPDNQIENLLGRGDFIIDLNNELKCIEFNIATSLGGWQIDTLSIIYRKSTFISEYLKFEGIKLKASYFFSSLFQHIKYAIDKLEIDIEQDVFNIAFVNEELLKGDIVKNEQLSVLKDYFERYKNDNFLKGELLFCSYKDIECLKGAILYKGIQIHCIIELDAVTPLQYIWLAKKKKILSLNGAIYSLMTNKFNLSLLSEYKDSSVFSENEKKIIEKHIPWGRKLIDIETTYRGKSESLINLVINRQERFVLKKAFGSQGENVFIGSKISNDKWKELIEKAAKEKDWLVQEYIKPQEYWYQINEIGAELHEAIFGLFAFGSLYAGGFIRIIPVGGENGVINSKLGASESTMLIVD